MGEATDTTPMPPPGHEPHDAVDHCRREHACGDTVGEALGAGE
jgi:hypothetical protein